MRLISALGYAMAGQGKLKNLLPKIIFTFGFNPTSYFGLVSHKWIRKISLAFHGFLKWEVN